MRPTPDLLNATELMQRLGLGHTRFHQLRKQGQFHHLETRRPLGQRRYSRVLVEKFLAGESTVQFTRRAS